MIAEKHTVRTAEMRCPHCNHPVDAHTETRGRKVLPADGDVTVCFYCKALLKFIKGGTDLEGVTVEEIEKIKAEDPELYEQIPEAVWQINRKKAFMGRVN